MALITMLEKDVEVLYTGYRVPSVTIKKIWIRPGSLQQETARESLTPYQVWSTTLG
jgi:hypothetical protein